MSRKAVLDQLQELNSSNPVYFGAKPSKSNIKIWNGFIIGPDDTPYCGGCFKIRIEFLDEYPLVPPEFYFETPIYHPNICSNGAVCSPYLRELYTANVSISFIFSTILSTLINPNPKDPMTDRTEMAREFIERRSEFDRKAREMTIQHAYE
ncbi:hypothetical protein SteCoe_38299 [Stentor coeruleus]|uniref:UBC core domain-containing protein n=1 Tax=Stentor coeruleus TaxID=5963 RepID=A0A1R2ALI4_9CILI|nr:hypothetical protein SteCoe_38299 [Stentor coeruleus]